MNIITGHWWEKAVSDMYCINHVLGRSVNTQGSCQALCEAKSESECVGIAFSHKISDSCYLCEDDALSPLNPSKGMGFYRRPGMFKNVFHGCLTESLEDSYLCI